MVSSFCYMKVKVLALKRSMGKIFFICILLPIKIISLILSRVNYKEVGRKREIPEKKNNWPPASRTWLVSHDSSWARTHSGEMTSSLER